MILSVYLQQRDSVHLIGSFDCVCVQGSEGTVQVVVVLTIKKINNHLQQKEKEMPNIPKIQYCLNISSHTRTLLQ